MCSTKKKEHATETDAEIFLASRKNRKHREMHIYQCEKCSKWHATKWTPEQHAKRLIKKKIRIKLKRGIRMVNKYHSPWIDFTLNDQNLDQSS